MFSGPRRHRDTIPCRTSDGLQLAVRRIPSTRGASRGAVILQHGLGSNGFLFDLPGHSLARTLAAEGYDCFISELRGAGSSDHPGRDFGIDDYVERDLPAILDAVRSDTGRERVSWVGHSMGGILMMFYAIEHPDAPVDRFVALGSALDYRPGKSAFRQLRAARPFAGDWLKVFPFGEVARVNALFAGQGPVVGPEKMNFWRSNVDKDVLRAVLSKGFGPISMRLLDDLDTTFAPGGFSRDAGKIVYLPRAKDFRLATCLMAGSRDVQAVPESIDATVRALSHAPELEVRRLGRAFGHADDYGHVDLVVGKRAHEEVWPLIVDFLGRPLQVAA
jgi:pimeloyl-ACP methyl ester carboxylesterase